MLQTIRKRLQALEQAQGTVNTPECVFITWDEAISHWVAIEQYVQRDSRKNILPMTGTTRRVLIDSPDSYKPPKDFTGTILKEGDME